MTLPFMKNKEGGMAGPIEVKEREPDHEEYELLDAVAEDIMAAIEGKNHAMLKEALEALCEYIKEEDEQQDQDLIEMD